MESETTTMLAADNWCIKVNDKVYGPYSSKQLRKFAHEGRLASWSLIAPAGGRSWRRAEDVSAFSSFFRGEGQTSPEAKNPTAGGKPSFGRRNIDEESAANGKTASRPDAKSQSMPSVSNFIIIFDVVSAAASRAEAAILSLGTGFRIADNVWTIACELTVIGVRNAIAPYLQPHESIFVVDASNGRTSWQNFPPELHAKLSARMGMTKRAS